MRLIIAFALSWIAAQATAAEPFSLQDGDRVVLVGGTLIEREPSYGYVETALTAAFPERTIRFRNLGWSGDTVAGIARARFGPPEEGFLHLKEHVVALKPTVVLIAYGMNESFEGQAGMGRFREGMLRLLDTLGETNARIVLIAPTSHETLAPPLPDPSGHNAELILYREVIREIAVGRDLAYLDLAPLGAASARSQHVTEEGTVPNALGYWRLAAIVARFGGAPESRWSVTLGKPDDDTLSFGTRISDLERSPTRLRFTATDARLPFPASPSATERKAGADRTLTVHGLAARRHVLKVDGAEVIGASSADWDRGVAITGGPEREQIEALRRAIIRKNLLYFHRWRPQNETYLYGFRKHEQGQNAREVPLFDPLVEEQEAVIARLKVPVPHRYELAADPEAR